VSSLMLDPDPARTEEPRQQARPGAAPLPPEQVLLQMAGGKWVCQALKVAAELGVADVLAGGAMSADEIARRTGSNPDALYRLLRALAGLGVFTERSDRRFENNALSTPLRSDVPRSARAMVRWIGEEAAWHAWAEFAHSVRTGEPAFDHFHDEQVFDYFAKHPHSAEIFNGAMMSFSASTGPAVARAYDFSEIKELVDVGGGHGGLLLAIAERFPAIDCVLFDRLEVIAGAGHVLSKSPHAGRIETKGGDFLEGVPEGADAYIMKHIIHDWDDERCVRILGHCAAAAAEDGRVLVVDQVVTDRPESAFSKIMDLEMLAMTPGGRERTEPEFRKLFQQAGLVLTRVVPTDSVVSIIEGRKALH
jgi:hypothetical protein